MKKIVGILAAVAMAASLFAVDISAALKFNGSLFDMTFADGAKPSALTLKHPEGRKPWGQTGIDLNVSADKAGATMSIENTGSICDYKMWIQPIDALKINFGSLDYCLNKESIDYAGCLNGAGSQGIAADITAGGFTLNLIFNPGYGNAWFDGTTVKNTAVMAKYGADFGTIGLAWIAEAVETKSFGKNTISVGYSNNFNGISMFVDAAMILGTSLSNIKADLFVKGNADAFGYAAYVDFDFDAVNSKVASVGAKAKLTYALDACTPYLYVKAANVLANPFEMTIKPGVKIGRAHV